MTSSKEKTESEREKGSTGEALVVFDRVARKVPTEKVPFV